MTYFRAGLATVVLFGLAIGLQPKGRPALHRRASLASLAAAACYAAFIVYPSAVPLPGGAEALDPSFRAG